MRGRSSAPRMCAGSASWWVGDKVGGVQAHSRTDTTATTPLKRTPLRDVHVKAGARMVPFGGWEMPVQYTGIVDEHRAVRRAVGLFDISHMGEFEIDGPDALAIVQ